MFVSKSNVSLSMCVTWYKRNHFSGWRLLGHLVFLVPVWLFQSRPACGVIWRLLRLQETEMWQPVACQRRIRLRRPGSGGDQLHSAWSVDYLVRMECLLQIVWSWHEEQEKELRKSSTSIWRTGLRWTRCGQSVLRQSAELSKDISSLSLWQHCSRIWNQVLPLVRMVWLLFRMLQRFQSRKQACSGGEGCSDLCNKEFAECEASACANYF